MYPHVNLLLGVGSLIVKQDELDDKKMHLNHYIPLTNHFLMVG